MAGGRRVRMAFWALWRRLAPRRAGLLVFLGGCGLVAAGAFGRRWVGKYRLSIRLLTEESLAELSEDLFLSWLAYHYLNLLSIAGILAGLLCCLVGLIWVVRARSITFRPARSRGSARRSKRVAARIIRSSRGVEPAGTPLLGDPGKANRAKSGA